MKRLYGIIFIIAALVVYNTSCSSKDQKHKRHYTLRVIIDTSSNFYLDSVSISAKFVRNPYLGGYIEQTYDSLYKSYAYKFDSVENGSLTIRLQSRLDRNFSKKILLKSDTTIFLSKTEIPSFWEGNLDSLNFIDVNPGEKVCLATYSAGCFHLHIEKSIIQRENEKYRIRFISNRPTSAAPQKTDTTITLNSSFKDSLMDLQSSMIKFLRKKHFGECTTSKAYYIQRGNTVYTFWDITCSDEISYYKILRMIKPDWFKLTTESQESN
jgi:hypothetical protein